VVRKLVHGQGIVKSWGFWKFATYLGFCRVWITRP